MPDCKWPSRACIPGGYNEPRQSLVDPGVNHGFEPDYGFEIFRGIRPTKRVSDAGQLANVDFDRPAFIKAVAGGAARR
jgi:hypothetical protein